MPFFNTLFSDSFSKTLFLMAFIIGFLGVFFSQKHSFIVKIDLAVIAIIIFYLAMIFLMLTGSTGVWANIPISLSFWVTFILFTIIPDVEVKKRIGKYLIIIFIITCLTSSIGVVLDNTAARTIAHATSDPNLRAGYKLKNIGNVFLFQGMVFAVPITIALSRIKEKKNWRVLGIVLVVAIGLILVNASFTIALLGYFLSIFLSIFLLGKMTPKKMFVSLLLLLLMIGIVVFGDSLLTFFAEQINNYRITTRLLDLRDVIYRSGLLMISTDVGLRFDLYLVSWKTFVSNPFGVGGYYTYQIYQNGIGYHSQILDDLARYGLLAIAFYMLFFNGYYIRLKKEWNKIGLSSVALIILMIYFIFLLFNIGFRSSEESILMLFILPILPEIVLEHESKKKIDHNNRIGRVNE